MTSFEKLNHRNITATKKTHPLECVFFYLFVVVSNYFASSSFTKDEISLPSAFPANLPVSTPITFPIS